MKAIVLLLLLVSCGLVQDSEAIPLFFTGVLKQKQRVAFLQKRLDAAERSLLKNQEEVGLLREEICEAQLLAIEAQIQVLEEAWLSDPRRLAEQMRQEASLLFLEERETLHRMIQSGSFLAAAQGLLDRILQLITQVSDSDPAILPNATTG